MMHLTLTLIVAFWTFSFTTLQVQAQAQGSCITIGGAIVGAKCVFPFKFNKKTYNGCTFDDSDGKYWCSTQTDSNGVHIGGQGLWGHCSPLCRKEYSSKDEPINHQE